MLMAGATASGCGAFGNYLANRARDFGECFRVQVGLGFGVGGGVKVSGLVEAGLGGGFAPYYFGGGWVYGMRNTSRIPAHSVPDPRAIS